MIRVVSGIRSYHRAQAAALYWEAFGPKLDRALGPAARGCEFVERVLRVDHAISAVDDDDRLIGIAGFKTHKGALVEGGLTDMVEVYGYLGGLWRTLALGLLATDEENERFLIDGLCVARHARGQGVGRALIAAIKAEAQSRGYAEVRLDVITTNIRARALYEREGFQAVQTKRIGPLRLLFGFEAATTMISPTR